MTIGIDASRANLENKTGTEWYSFHVIQQLKQLIPEDIQVILYSKEPLRPELADLPKNWTSKVLAWPPKFLWTQLRLSWQMLWRKPDLLYIPAHTIPLIHPKKIALVVHDVGFERDSLLYDEKLIGYDKAAAKKLINFLVKMITLGKYSASEQDYHKFAMKLAIKYATKIITISEFSKAEIIDVYEINSERIQVILNGFNPIKVPAINKQPILDKYSISQPYIFYVGRVEEKKNIPNLIDAFAILKQDYHYTGQLVLAGKPGFGHDIVLQKLKEHGLTQDVVLTDWTPDDDLSILMTQAELFILPSLYEGFGIPILEAMSVAVPVICSSIPALKEVGAQAAHYFDPNSSADMARQLNKVLSNDELQEKLVQAGLDRIKLFSWSQTGSQTWEIIRQLISQK